MNWKFQEKFRKKILSLLKFDYAYRFCKLFTSWVTSFVILSTIQKISPLCFIRSFIDITNSVYDRLHVWIVFPTATTESSETATGQRKYYGCYQWKFFRFYKNIFEMQFNKLIILLYPFCCTSIVKLHLIEMNVIFYPMVSSNYHFWSKMNRIIIIFFWK